MIKTDYSSWMKGSDWMEKPRNWRNVIGSLFAGRSMAGRDASTERRK